MKSEKPGMPVTLRGLRNFEELPVLGELEYNLHVEFKKEKQGGV